MQLEGRNAVIYGGAGALGSAVAREFARQGANVHLVGRSADGVRALAAELRAEGATCSTAAFDAGEERAVDGHAARIAEDFGGIDVSLNAVGIRHVQGTPLRDLSLAEFEHPVHRYLRTNFLTAKAAARHMATRERGVILTVSTPGSRLSGPGFLGYGVACGAIETFTRILAGEVGRSGIRVVCLRPQAMPETVRTSHVGELFSGMAAGMGVDTDEWLELARQGTLLGRLPSPRDVAAFAAWVASDGAAAMTAEIANLSCGAIVD